MEKENERTVKGMAEYIEREALREAFDNADADIVEEYGDGDCDWGFGRKNVLEVINSVPAADVAPVRHGRWELCRLENCAICSACGDEHYLGTMHQFSRNYCPNCGAKMDLKEGTNA